MPPTSHPLYRHHALLVALLLLLCLPAGGARPLRADAASAAPAAPLVQSEPERLVTLLVELSAPSAVEALAQARAAQGPPAATEAATGAANAAALAAATQAAVAAAGAEQDALQASLAALGAQTLYRAQRVYNGIAVRLPAAQVESLHALPGVRAVSPILAKAPDNRVSVPFLGLPAVWQAAGGTAKEVRVAVIDTGIDYAHATFGGRGLAAPENDPTRIGDVPDFPSLKVVGGYDFVGDDYNANPNLPGYQPEPQPDPDPMDCWGHGTHVAGTVAGYGVTGPGKPFAGPWNAAADIAAMRVGPGVAPEAQLYALKVFGCTGASDVVDQAIEWAVDPNGDGDFADRVDVINLSLGSAFGGPEDTTSRAVEAAAATGVIVVASAGNAGDVYYAMGSPAAAPHAISVAATVVEQFEAGEFGSAHDTLAGFSARGPNRAATLKPDVSAPGDAITSARLGSGIGTATYSGTSMAAPHVAGVMAILRQTHPDWSANDLKALLINSAAPAVRVSDAYTSTLYPPMRAGAGRVDIAAALRSDLIAYADEPRGLVHLSFGALEVQGARSDTRRVRVVNHGARDVVLRPLYTPLADLPGAAVVLSTTETLTVPAGGAVAFPVLLETEAAALRDLPDATLAPPAGPAAWQAEEAGLLWFWPEPAHFDAAGGDDIWGAFTLDPVHRTLTYTVALSGTAPAAVSRVTLHRGPPGFAAAEPAYTLLERSGPETPSFPISGTLTLTASDLPLLAAGYLQLVIQTETPTGTRAAPLVAAQPVLKLPLYATPRPIAAMRAASSVLDFGTQASAARPLALAGAPLLGSNPPTTTQSLVSLLELHLRSPRAPVSRNPPTPGAADIQFVGMASDAPAAGGLARARLAFGVAMYEAWSTPSEVQIEIYIDSTGDGVPDHVVYNTDLRALHGSGESSDAFVAAVRALDGSLPQAGDPLNALPPEGHPTALFQSNVVLISLPAALLDLSARNSVLAIRVQTAVRYDNKLIGDSTPLLRFDAARPGLRLTGGKAGLPVFPDTPDTLLSIGFDRIAYDRSTADGLLLLHHHNGSGRRAEVVEIRYSWQHQLWLPFAGR